MRFSMIVATLGRVDEVRELLGSFSLQILGDFEVIIVDQNSDDRLAWIEKEPYSFPLTRIRSQIRHSSHARNLGLRQACGDIVSFPDDDCTYPPDLLAVVDQEFRKNPELHVRTGRAVATLGGTTTAGRWRAESGPIDIANVWTSVIESNLFIRRDTALNVGGFDEQLGVGGTFGSAEGNDLAARALGPSRLGWYDTAQLVVHPDKSLSSVLVGRAFTYGAGLGYALCKNKAPIKVCLTFAIRPLGGAMSYLVLGQFLKARYHWRTLLGRIYGFQAYRAAKKSAPQTWGSGANAVSGTDAR